MSPAERLGVQLVTSWAGELGLTVLCCLLSLLLFAVTYVLLWRLLAYRQRRLSLRSGLLFLCLLWAGLRAVLYSFHLNSLAQARPLRPFPHWLPYCAPGCLQYLTLCLINVFLAQVVVKSRCAPEFSECRRPLCSGYVFLGLVYVAVNLSLTLIGGRPDSPYTWAPTARIITSDALYIVCSLSLPLYICRITGAAPASVYLESKGMSSSLTIVMSVVCGVVYLLRACYNLVMVSSTPKSQQSPFTYGWDGVALNDPVEENDNKEYFTFGMTFLICEVLPMVLMLLVFRPQNLHEKLQAGGMVNSQSFGSRAYFFDNPRRYDSDEDLPKLPDTKGQASASSTKSSSSWNETICPSGSCAVSPPLQKQDPSSRSPVHFTCGSHAVA